MKTIIKSTISGLAAMGMLASSASAACTNDAWNKVMSRGKIVVGVKADYKPWGYRNTDGDIVGMEIDMANDVAAKMGVDIELVAVQSSNRMQFLEQGKIDLMIATMSDRKDRRELVGIVGPNYYTSGTNVMSPKALGLTEWEDLRDKPVCGKQGAFYNQIVEQRYGAKIIAFTGNAEAKQALRDKNASHGCMMTARSGLTSALAIGMISKCLWPQKMTTPGLWPSHQPNATVSLVVSCLVCSTSGIRMVR